MEIHSKKSATLKKTENIYRIFCTAILGTPFLFNQYDKKAIGILVLMLLGVCFSCHLNLESKRALEDTLQKHPDEVAAEKPLRDQLTNLWKQMSRTRKFGTLFLLVPVTIFVGFLIIWTYRPLSAILIIGMIAIIYYLEVDTQLLKRRLYKD